MTREETKPVLVIGFGAIITILAITLFFGIAKIGQLSSDIELIVAKHNQRIDAMSRMRQVAREHALLIQNLMTSRDPFERHDLSLGVPILYAQFRAAGESLPIDALTAPEMGQLDQIWQQARQTNRIMKRVVAELLSENDEFARQLFYNEALPSQNSLIRLMDAAIKQQHDLNHEVLNTIKQRHDGVIRTLLMLGLFTFVLSIVISKLVIDRNRRAILQLQSASNTLREEIVQRAHVEEKLRESELRERTIRENALDAIILINQHGIVESCNPAVSQIFGYGIDEVLGNNINMLMPMAERSRHDGYLANYLSTGASTIIGAGREVEGLHRDGQLIPLELGVTEVQLDGARKFIGVLHDISSQKVSERLLHQAYERLETRVIERTAELKEANDMLEQEIVERTRVSERLSYLASHDPLTGLPNRAMFTEHLDNALKQARRYDLRLALLFMDLDGFKQINDTLGHIEGDELLQQVAQRLRSTVRESDIIARVGGDEFTMIMSDIPDDDAVQRVAQKIIAAASAPYTINGITCYVGISIGIAIYPEQSTDADTLMKIADNAMYGVKKSGKNDFRLYS